MLVTEKAKWARQLWPLDFHLKVFVFFFISILNQNHVTIWSFLSLPHHYSSTASVHKALEQRFFPVKWGLLLFIRDGWLDLLSNGPRPSRNQNALFSRNLKPSSWNISSLSSFIFPSTEALKPCSPRKLQNPPLHYCNICYPKAGAEIEGSKQSLQSAYILAHTVISPVKTLKSMKPCLGQTAATSPWKKQTFQDVFLDSTYSMKPRNTIFLCLTCRHTQNSSKHFIQKNCFK